jgi:MFS family permease
MPEGKGGAAPPRWSNLVAAIATISAVDVAMGLTLPILSLLLEKRGVSASLIGLNAAMGPLGIILAGPFMPTVVRRVGTKRLAEVVIVLSGLLLLAFKAFPSLLAWFLIRFVAGVAGGTIYTLSEAWIVHFAEGPRRGRITGIYTSVLSLSFAAGPLLIPYVDIDSWVPWLIGFAMIMAAYVPLRFLSLDDDDFRSGEHQSFAAFVGRAPLLLFAVSTATVFDAVMLSFFAIYGLRNGLSLHTASWALGVAIAGNALLQYPIGIMADRWSRPAIMWLSALMTIVLVLLLPWAINHWLLWPVVFLMGTTAYAIYTAALAILGDRFKGAELIAGSAAFGATWGVGGIVGPPLAGIIVDGFGIGALPFFFAGTYGLLVVLLALSRGNLVRSAR